MPVPHAPHPTQSFAEKLAKLQAVEGTPAEPAEFSLNFLWLDKNIAVAVDQVFGPVSRPRRLGMQRSQAWPASQRAWLWQYSCCCL
jgi:hypothetical protein